MVSPVQSLHVSDVKLPMIQNIIAFLVMWAFNMMLKLIASLLTVFNQKTLYDAYKKRSKNIEVDLEEYNKIKEADPEFYREASSLQYGKVLLLSRLYSLVNINSGI